MANVKFAYGTRRDLSTSTSGFDDGCIYFSTSSKNISLRQGSSIYTFNGNDTLATAGYSMSGASVATLYAYCNIQNVPVYKSGTDYQSSYDGTPWYTWIGQNVVSAKTLVSSSSSMGFDYAIGQYKDLPPIEYAKEIIVAIDTHHLSIAANDGTSPDNILGFFSDYPEDCIVHCYRTRNSARANDSTIPSASSAMFSGYTHLSSINSTSDTFTNITRVGVNLCVNGTNAIEVNLGACRLQGGEAEFSSFVKQDVPSGQYSNYSYWSTPTYPDMERHVYPIAIRYI